MSDDNLDEHELAQKRWVGPLHHRLGRVAGERPGRIAAVKLIDHHLAGAIGLSDHVRRLLLAAVTSRQFRHHAGLG